MFSSFFPNPKVFFLSAIAWTALAMTIWYGAARDLGPTLSVGNLIGLPYPADSAAPGSGDRTTSASRR